MSFIVHSVIAYLSALCRLFSVTPDSLRKGRRGNLPPAQGGIGQVGTGW